ncbi:MAG: sodium:proton antiporter [Chitinispirillaceae bacterium]|nr:sodium:proton antiporter [Chitinispirillaceae bacterium]
MIEKILLSILFLCGFGGLIIKKNLIKKVIGISIINSAVILLFILEGSTIGNRAPFITTTISSPNNNLVDPIPQALMLTTIVVGFCVTALALVLVYLLYKEFKTLDIEIIYGRIRNEQQ